MNKTNKARLRRKKLGVVSISAIVMVLLIIISLNGYELQKKNEAYIAREDKLTAQIDEEKERTKEIEDLKKYVQTKKYVEEVAKDKLGLVYPGEIIFKSDNK